jgi:hypothetical protein
VIIALFLAAQAAQPPVFTPDEEKAMAAIGQCQKRYFDSVAQEERRRKGGTLIDESYGVCAKEESTLRTMLRVEYDPQATDHLIQLIRNASRDMMLDYIKR